MKTFKGNFKPTNPQKYEGDPTNIVYRSSWELKCMRYFDQHPGVLRWSSEEIVIPYLSPVDGRYHRYYPDFKVKMETGTVLVEVKPFAQTQAPVVGNKKKKTLLNEVKTYAVNQAKWAAARNFCDVRGWKFITMTEKEIFNL